MPKGTRTISTRWVDVNKQDEENPLQKPLSKVHETLSSGLSSSGRLLPLVCRRSLGFDFLPPDSVGRFDPWTVTSPDISPSAAWWKRKWRLNSFLWPGRFQGPSKESPKLHFFLLPLFRLAHACSCLEGTMPCLHVLPLLHRICHLAKSCRSVYKVEPGFWRRYHSHCELLTTIVDGEPFPKACWNGNDTEWISNQRGQTQRSTN